MNEARSLPKRSRGWPSMGFLSAGLLLGVLVIACCSGWLWSGYWSRDSAEPVLVMRVDPSDTSPQSL